jgi:hypothetical protein
MHRIGKFSLYPYNRHLSPKVRVFIDLLVSAFLPVTPWEQVARPGGQKNLLIRARGVISAGQSGRYNIHFSHMLRLVLTY